MIVPDLFETSLTDAENAAFNVLLEATESQANKSGYLGLNPGIVNAWYFEALNSINDTVFYANDVPSMAVQAKAECSFIRRSDCQKWLMRIVAALPISNHEESNIVEFRINNESPITFKDIQMANENKTIRIWVKEITFDLVFLTGGKASNF